MPISCLIQPRPLTQEEFATIDYQVMRYVFDSQNRLGRLCDEEIYKNDLAARIEASGLGPVRKELPLTVTHRDFSKSYFMDLVVGDAAVYELKAALNLIPEHDNQLLNYLFLWGAHHGKLVNFRPVQVESRFLNTNLTPILRKRFEINSERWREQDAASESLRKTVASLLDDWGAFLDFSLYLEAVTHFLGGETQVVRMVPLARESVQLGNQRLHLLGPAAAFRISSLTDNTLYYERHLHSLLRHSPLRVMHWINFNHHEIQFVTLEK